MRKLYILFIGLSAVLGLYAQSFEVPQANPFGLNFDNLVLEYHFASFTDLDADGDQDMLVSDFDGFFYYVENTGTSTSPQFKGGIQNPFGISRVDYNDCSCNTMVHRFIDIDADGDKDIIAIAWYGAEYWFAENIGTSTNPSYSDFSNEVAWMPPSFTYGPYPGIDFADIDNDGDLDLFSCQGDELNLIENIGTASSPDFTGGHQADPFGVEVSGKNLFPTLVDIDGDGDQDLFIGGNSFLKEDFQFYENIGTPELAVFDTLQENPFNLENSEIDFPSFSFVDINGDTDLDIFMGGKLDDDMAFAFYENNTYSTNVNELENSNFSIYPNPSNGLIKLKNSTNDQINSIKVYDALGVLHFSMDEDWRSAYLLDLKMLDAGHYFLEVQTDNGTEIIKLFKQ